MKTARALIMLVILAAGIGLGIWLGRESTNAPYGESAVQKSERKIKYWVAPMNPDYRSDRPGKSPMGMDLVPVYEDETVAAADVLIEPTVINQLGIRVAEVRRTDIARELETVGYVQYDEDTLRHVHPRAVGWIERLNAKSVGDSVAAGDTLFELYAPTLVNAQEEYLHAVRSGSASLIRASHERLTSLAIDTGQIQRLRTLNRPLQRIAVKATAPGVVTHLPIREGMYVTPATEVMTLADLSTVWVVAEVFESQARWVRPGQSVSARFDYHPTMVRHGTVDFIYPTLDPTTRAARVRVRFANPEELLQPGMFADIRIDAAPREQSITVPREAVIRTRRGERVAVSLGEGRFDIRSVRIGIESGVLTEVLDGLEPGEKVVVSGQFLIDSEADLDAALDRLDHSTEHSP